MFMAINCSLQYTLINYFTVQTIVYPVMQVND
jgi:hypothetical protein